MNPKVNLSHCTTVIKSVSFFYSCHAWTIPKKISAQYGNIQCVEFGNVTFWSVQV